MNIKTVIKVKIKVKDHTFAFLCGSFPYWSSGPQLVDIEKAEEGARIS